MTGLLPTIDDFLRGQAAFAPEPAESIPARHATRSQIAMIVVCGALYGAVMGSYNGFAGDGWKQVLLSTAKVPMLFLVTFLLCLPSFYVINLVLGLHSDFPRVLNALLAFQCMASIVLVSLAPITELMNVSTTNYTFMVLWSGVMFAVASALGNWRMRQVYRALITRDARHRHLRLAWSMLYVFVGVQMAWTLRPFVGDPHQPFQLLRTHAWGNAYVEIAGLVLRLLHQ
ncbi:MAG TPA: hypothetical protein VLZ30_03085 [Verrucomicrobiae bacterium]|nr:hypothetical protein [Verrucomicrobiae bacterium]